MADKVPGKRIIAVLPAYYAVKTLKRTVDAIPKDWVDEIILVDDASADETAELAKSLGITTIVHQKNLGYGGNQKTCYRTAIEHGADIAVMVHPDFQYDPSYIPDLIETILANGAGAAFGSRMIIPGGARKGGMPWWKYAANIFLTKIENFVLGLSLTEYHSGFRAYTREALTALPLENNADGFSFDSEIIVELRLAGFRIREIPITTRYFKEASMIGFWKSTAYGLSILRLLFDYIFHIWGFASDFRFKFGRFPCRVCGARDNYLLYPSNISATLSKTYSITEDAVGKHGDIYYCLRCHSAFVSDAGIPPDISGYYREQACDPRYLAEEEGRRKSFGRVLKRIEKLASRGKVLDVGAGPGFFLQEASAAKWDVEGIELSKASVRYALDRFQIRLRQGDFSEMGRFPESSFDAVTAFDVLEHIEKPGDFLEHAHRLLKPGGILLLTTPRHGSLLQRIFRSSWYAVLPAHLTYFSPRGLSFIAEKHHFQPKLKKHFTRYFSLGYLWFRMKAYFEIGPREINLKWLIPVQFFDEMEWYLIKKP